MRSSFRVPEKMNWCGVRPRFLAAVYCSTIAQVAP